MVEKNNSKTDEYCLICKEQLVEKFKFYMILLLIVFPIWEEVGNEPSIP